MPEQHPNLPASAFFTKFANVYSRQTGNSTLNILKDVISGTVQPSANPIGPESVVHDTAAGPGIGAAAIIACLPQEQLPKHVLVTDNTPMMVTVAKEALESAPLSSVEVRELDSQDLKDVPSDHFTHSINNFSIFTFLEPVSAIRETYRTLRPGGLAVVTCWSRFPPMHLVRAAQASIRPDIPGMPIPGQQFLEKGVLEQVVSEAGFEKDKMSLTRQTLVVNDEENVAGLTAHMSGPMLAKAREGYTADEEGRWADEIETAIKAEREEFGGIKFDAYILLAIK